MFIGAVAKALPKKLSHRILKKQKREALLLLFDRHCGRARYDFYLRLQKSVELLRSETSNLINETIEAIEEAIQKGLRQREDGTKSIDSALRLLEKEHQQLQNIRGEFDEMKMLVIDTMNILASNKGVLTNE